MTAIKARQYKSEISQEATQIYIIQMLEELSAMARSSGLKETASLLKATSVASQVDLHLETDS